MVFTTNQVLRLNMTVTVNKIYTYLEVITDLKHCISYKYKLNEIISFKYCLEKRKRMRRGGGGRISFSHSSRLKGYTVSVECSVSTLLSSLITHHPPTETFALMTPRDGQVYCSQISQLYGLE